MSATTTQTAKKTEDITLQAPSGQTEVTKFNLHQTVAHTLEQAVKEFGQKGWLDASVPYILVLGSTPLDPSQTLAQAGVTAGATLKLRAKAIPGDGNAPRAV